MDEMVGGVVGTENKNLRNFKDLQEIQRNAKSLKRNARAHKDILIAPSKLPRLSSAFEIPALNFLTAARNVCRLPAKDLRHGWQADSRDVN